MRITRCSYGLYLIAAGSRIPRAAVVTFRRAVIQFTGEYKLPKKKARARLPDASGPQEPQPPGAHGSPVLSFLERHSLALALCLIAIATVRIVGTYSVFSNTSDEPTTLGCGLQYLGKHIYQYEPQHPPLARVASAVMPYLAGARPLGMADMGDDGRTVIFNSGNPSRMLFLMRLGILPFFILAAMAVYAWARRHFGKAAGAIATGLFTMLPPVLAHGGLVFNDTAPT